MCVSIPFLTVEKLKRSRIVYMPSSVILVSKSFKFFSLSLLSPNFIDNSTQHFSLIDQLFAMAEFN